mgnify:FL=1
MAESVEPEPRERALDQRRGRNRDTDGYEVWSQELEHHCPAFTGTNRQAMQREVIDLFKRAGFEIF